MNSRWQANKIGLVNFWYYDEQEFPFAKGRMLLRGSNGSGKSVTMQSVVPLLLDGNMSPERLDPFGTRDRKMSNYLLEDDDDREERTGYLYLEFRRQESDTFLTIGMGLRARRGKSLDKWYFAITDGRRIGKDFLLYKQMGEKIPLSKKELENRIATGGKVLDRQAEYMDFVNRHIFGFETIDEYKEMIDLLIQLRTPKLSKDFKPSVISEILSDSLQPLSDEDLRPMSEAIENMDTMNMNLKARENARQAATKISRVFDRYNQLMLYQKADRYMGAVAQKKALLSEITDNNVQLQKCNEIIEKVSENLANMDAKNRSLQKEKDSLNKSDALQLKTREVELTQDIAQYQNTLGEKKDFLASKQEKYAEVANRRKAEEDNKYQKEKEIEELLEEMQDEAENMAFEEHQFFCDEFMKQLDKQYTFDTLQSQFTDTKQKIDKTLHILEETGLWDRQADDLMKRQEEVARNVDSLQKRQKEVEMLLIQCQNEWKEAVYHWNETNELLQIDQEMLATMSHFADDYDSSSDFTQMKEMVSEKYLEKRMELAAGIDEIKRNLDKKKTEYAELETELAEWENQKEPQPERNEAVARNRERLDRLGIEYQEFYKVIEFGNDMEESAQNRLEEALLEMGILDALIIDEQYKDQALAFEEGCSDHYLFASGNRADTSLLDILELNDDVNDIFSNQRITNLLSHIAYDSANEGAIQDQKPVDMMRVAADGVYQVGVLYGTLTGQYTAQYIGTKARQKTRLLKIEECRSKLAILSAEMIALENKIAEGKEELLRLKGEYENMPNDSDMAAAWKMLDNASNACEIAQKEQLRLEEELRLLKEKIRKKKEEAFALAKALYLDCTYPVIAQASEAAGAYKDHLTRLTSMHELYLHRVELIRELYDQMANIDADMDQIRYDIVVAERELKKRTEEYQSVLQQLALTDYEQIKERLDYCVNWLQDYPRRMRQLVEEKTKNQELAKRLQETIKQCEEKKKECDTQENYFKKCYEEELALTYVKLPEELEGNPDKVCAYLGTDVKALELSDMLNRLNQVYFENRAFLNDYQLMQTELFQELDEEHKIVGFHAKRQDILARYKGVKIPFVQLLGHLEEDIIVLKDLIKDGDRELFEDILANTVSRKIRGKINASTTWVSKMNDLMNAMDTSSGLKLSLRWRSKTAESEDQLDTKELVQLLKKDYRLMTETESAKLSSHFRSKVEEARRNTRDSGGMISFYQVMKDTLDYRKWFEFQLYSQKTGERKKELTNSVFGTFSGGEKAMSMYVPLFSAVVAKYQGGRADAPRLISLDEAFAGVDNSNIRDMFRLMTEFSFDFIINSQVLWGDCDTLDALAIYQLQRPKNAKFVTVMPYLWNGHVKELLENETMIEKRSADLTS